jgi:hypothetical protein
VGKPVALKPITVEGVANAFPDVCETILPLVGKIPLPFTNVAKLMDADTASDVEGKKLLVGPLSLPVLLQEAVIEDSSGDEVGFLGGVMNEETQGKCRIMQASSSVKYNGKGIVRFMDATFQNMDDYEQPNANGYVMSGFPTVLVGD